MTDSWQRPDEDEPSAERAASSSPFRAASDTEPEIPRLLDTVVFFVLAVVVTLSVGIAVAACAELLPAFRNRNFKSLAVDARLTVPSQAIGYLALLGAAALLFRAVWHRPFWQGLSWNAAAVARRWVPLLAAGLGLGVLNGVASNYLPMPKEAPIMSDLMRSAAGAWMMFVFGTTLAPLVEEVAFRGFLLPSLIHFFRWATRRGPREQPSVDSLALQAPPVDPPADSPLDPPFPESPSLAPPSMAIVGAAILIVSALFALLHGEQVSGAWAPVLLIGVVSVALCVVRLRTKSLAASAFVHATYNFTLFAGMLIASDGFRHLEKLNN